MDWYPISRKLVTKVAVLFYMRKIHAGSVFHSWKFCRQYLSHYRRSHREVGHYRYWRDGWIRERLKALSPSADIVMILLTHGHLDHAGHWVCKDEWNVPTYLPAKNVFYLIRYQCKVPCLVCTFDRPCGRIDHEIDDGLKSCGD